jgi:LuxR family maltose regulon positive regulatory protein
MTPESSIEGPEGSSRKARSRVVPVKVRPPTLRTDVVARPRLTRSLEESHARIVLVSAPAGFGKTVLVQEWLAGRKAPTAWLSVDALDNDPERFFTHLGAAFRQAGGEGFGDAAEFLTDGTPGRREDAAVHLVQALSAVRPGAALVVDDVHLLSAPPVWGFLGRLVAGS